MTGEEIYEQFNNYILKSAYCFQKYFEQHTEEDLYQEYWTEIMENIDSINTVEDLKSVLIKTRSRLQREQNLRVYERSYGIVLNTEIFNLPDPIYQLYGNREQQWYHEHLDEVHERQRKYYKKNKEKMHEYQKNYRKKRKTEMTEEEKEIERQKHRDYYEKNKEKYKQKRLEQKENGQSYYERNKEKIKAYQKERYKERNKVRDVEKDRARCREYYQAHKEELLKKKAEQYKERQTN